MITNTKHPLVKYFTLLKKLFCIKLLRLIKLPKKKGSTTNTKIWIVIKLILMDASELFI